MRKTLSNVVNPLDEIDHRADCLLQNPDTPKVVLEHELWAISEACERARQDNAQLSERLTALEGELGMRRVTLRLVPDDDDD